MEAADKPAILSALSRLFADSWDLDVEKVQEQLEERERLGSTGFGRGVAIPHARFPGLARPVAALLKLRHPADFAARSEEHTSELQSLMRISYAVFCLKK